MMIILLFFLLAFTLFWILILFRNKWVCRERISLIWEDYDSYDRLPSYHYMLFHFWVWDVKKFIKEKNESK